MENGAEDGKALNIVCFGECEHLNLGPFLTRVEIEDGGGVRALSSLLLVSELMNRVQDLEGLDAPPDPCKYFDVIAGTGTGGLIACMLGRMQMSVDQAIRSYSQLVKEVFSEKKLVGSSAFKSTKLKNAIRSIVRETTGNENESMVEGNDKKNTCKTMVFAMSKHNMNAKVPTIFRSYRGRANQAPKSTIWETLCATMAHPDLFKSIEIGDPIKESFVDGGLGCSNPLAHLLAEVKTMYPEQHVGSIISIGAGHTRTIEIPRSSWLQRFLPTNVIVAMKGLAEDSERVAEDMAMRFEHTKGVYYRFNVNQGMQSVEMSEWERLDEVAAHTRAYMQQTSITQHTDEAASAVKGRKQILATEQIDGRIRPYPTERPRVIVKRCPAPTTVFTGREEKLHQIENCIDGGHDERRICVVHGLGGAGKTQIVLKVIERSREMWSMVLYVDASSREAIESTLQGFAESNGIGKTHVDTTGWLESHRERWLLVFDNADSPSLNIRDFIPNCQRGSIIITTRLHDMGLLAQGPGGDCNVSSMGAEEALVLLTKVARLQDDQPGSGDISAATALLEDLGHLALAIVHAGAYIGHSGMNIAKYRDMFLARRQAMLEEYQRLLVKVDEYGKTVYTTWKMCYDLLGVTARSMLWLIAFLHFDGITEGIFERAAKNMSRKPKLPLSELGTTALGSLQQLLKGFLDPDGQWDSLRFVQTMNEISSYSLIEMDRVNQSYRVHVLVQDWARSVIPHPKDLAVECTTTLLFLSLDYEASSEAHAFRRGLGLHISKVQSERRNVLHADHAGYFANVYRDSGQWKESAALRGVSLDARKRILGDEHPSTLASMNNLALTYHQQGRHDEAEKLQLQVLDGSKRVHGDEHPYTLTAMNNLAVTYISQGRHDKAEQLQVQVLDTRTLVLGDEHPSTLISINNLAETYHDQGRLDEAENLQVRALNARKRLLGDEHPGTLTSMNNLALTYHDQGRLDEAEKLMESAFILHKRLLGESHAHTLQSEKALAQIQSERRATVGTRSHQQLNA